MNHPKYIFSAVLVTLLTLTTAAIAQPQSPIFVSARNGNDGNPCTVEAPCKTFMFAMTMVAPGGEIVVLDSGEYGLLPINKPVSVIAPDGVYAGITAISGQAVIIDPAVGNISILLRGLTIKGTGTGLGIAFNSRPVRLRIERCTITGFTRGIDFAVLGQQLGVLASQLFVTDSVFSQCSIGIFVGPASGSTGFIRATIENSRFDRNTTGVAGSSMSLITARNSAVSNSGGFGFRASGDNAELNLENCLITGGNTGVQPMFGINAPVTVRISNSTITNNRVGIGSPDCGEPGCPTVTQVLTRGNNTVEGNGTDGSFTGKFPAK
jgi:hypothetical protein